MDVVCCGGFYIDLLLSVFVHLTLLEINMVSLVVVAVGSGQGRPKI